MRKALALSGVGALVFAAAAVAAGPTIDVAVAPNTPSSHSMLTASASGPFSESGLPTSLKLTAQKGFKSSAKSVQVLCNTAKVRQTSPNPCPRKSKVGSGKVVATVQSLGNQQVPFKLYLGKPRHRGDIASIVLSGTLPVVNQQENVIGRLFKPSTGGVEILFPHMPKAPSGLTIKLNRLNLSAHAVNGRYSLITNPPACRRGHWTGTFQLTFSSGRVSKNTAIPCST